MNSTKAKTPPIVVKLLRLKAPDTDPWAKGTGAEYSVFLNDEQVGRVRSGRFHVPPTGGSRLLSGAMYTGWTAYARDASLARYTGMHHQSRQRAVAELIQARYRQITAWTEAEDIARTAIVIRQMP
jgi:hypothetical protein